MRAVCAGYICNFPILLASAMLYEGHESEGVVGAAGCNNGLHVWPGLAGVMLQPLHLLLLDFR